MKFYDINIIIHIVSKPITLLLRSKYKKKITEMLFNICKNIKYIQTDEHKKTQNFLITIKNLKVFNQKMETIKFLFNVSY